MMEDFNSETDSDYTSYWRDWVGAQFHALVGTFTTCLTRTSPIVYTMWEL